MRATHMSGSASIDFRLHTGWVRSVATCVRDARAIRTKVHSVDRFTTAPTLICDRLYRTVLNNHTDRGPCEVGAIRAENRSRCHRWRRELLPVDDSRQFGPNEP